MATEEPIDSIGILLLLITTIGGFIGLCLKTYKSCTCCGYTCSIGREKDHGLDEAEFAMLNEVKVHTETIRSHVLDIKSCAQEVNNIVKGLDSDISSLRKDKVVKKFLVNDWISTMGSTASRGRQLSSGSVQQPRLDERVQSEDPPRRRKRKNNRRLKRVTRFTSESD